MTHPAGRFHRCTWRWPSPVLAGSTRSRSVRWRFHTCRPVYRGVGQDRRGRAQRPRRPGAVRVALGVRRRRAPNPRVVEGPGDPRHRMAGEPLGEHPRHDRRRVRAGFQPVRPPPPGGVGLGRVRPGIGEPVPIRRAAAEVAALPAGLGRHRGADPDPGPGNLPLGLIAPAPASPPHDPRPRSRPGRPPPASTTARRNAPTTVPSKRTGRRRRPAHTPRSQRRPTRDPGSATAAAKTAARGRRAHASVRLCPMSKKEATIGPCPATSAAACACCRASAVTGS